MDDTKIPHAKPRGKSFSVRFWAKVNKDGPVPEHCPGLGPCWVWTGGGHNVVRPGKNHGLFSWHRPEGSGRATACAHRVGYALHHGISLDDIAGTLVLHHCDNPPCCNPAHLFLGTHEDNTRDMIAKGRENHPRGETHPNCKHSTETIRRIRELRAGGMMLRDIAQEAGVPYCVVTDVVYGRSRKGDV